MPRLPRAPLAATPQADAAQTAIAPPQDPHAITPDAEPVPPPGPLEMTARTAPTTASFQHAQKIWLELATKSWLRWMALPAELAACRNLEALLELQRRHVIASVNEALAGYAELAALSGDPMPRRVGAAGFTSTGV